MTKGLSAVPLVIDVKSGLPYCGSSSMSSSTALITSALPELFLSPASSALCTLALTDKPTSGVLISATPEAECEVSFPCIACTGISVTAVTTDNMAAASFFALLFRLLIFPININPLSFILVQLVLCAGL